MRAVVALPVRRLFRSLVLPRQNLYIVGTKTGYREMKQAEVELLAHAGVIARAVLMACPEGWKIYLYGESVQSVSRTDCVETARGGQRTWASLDSAYRWIRALPGKIRITIDG